MKKYYIANHNRYYAVLVATNHHLSVIDQAKLGLVEVGWLDYLIYILMKRNIYTK